MLNKSNNIEPVFTNMFEIEFPKCFNFPSDAIIKMSPIKFNFKTGWEEIKITIHDLIGMDVSGIINHNIVLEQEGTFILNKKDRANKIIEKINLNCKFIDVNFGEFNYHSDKLNEIIMTIKPISIIVYDGKPQ